MELIMDKMVDKTRMVDGNPTSLLELGYDNCGLDDAWQACGAGEKGTFYGPDGRPIVNKTTFPSLKSMTDYGHKRGLHVGWYLNNCICGCGPGTFNESFNTKIYHGAVNSVVEYGFDGVKFDRWVFGDPHLAVPFPSVLLPLPPTLQLLALSQHDSLDLSSCGEEPSDPR
jgi:alpha-galactosidase